MENKFKHVNVLKGLGIIAVVLGHVGFPYKDIIYLYHMALFFFISGYLYKESCEKNLFKYIVKKFKSLYIPFIVFELIFVCLRSILIDLNVYNASDVIRLNNINDWMVVFKQIVTFNYTGDSMIGAIWFLRVLFYVSILYAIFNVVFKKIVKEENDCLKTFIIVVLSVISFDLISKGYNLSIVLNPDGDKIAKLFIDILDARNFILMSIFYLGTLYKKYEDRIPMNIYLVLICIVALYYNTRLGSIDVSTYNFTGPIYFILNSILGIYVNLYIACIICNSKFKLVENAGKYSMFIMMLHIISSKLIDIAIVYITNMQPEIISGYPVSFYGKNIWILYTIVGIIIPLILAVLYNNIKNFFRSRNENKRYIIQKNMGLEVNT